MKVTIKVPRVTAREDPSLPVLFSKRPKQISGLRLGFLDNTKPNADRFLKQLAGRLQDHYDLANVRHLRKHDSSSPAGQSLLDELARECDAVVNPENTATAWLKMRMKVPGNRFMWTADLDGRIALLPSAQEEMVRKRGGPG